MYLLEFTNIVRSMHSRTFVVMFASTCECISLYQSPYTGRANLGYLYLSRVVFTYVLCQHQSSGICFNYVLSDKNDRPLILSDKNRENVDSTCHQPVIDDVVTVNNCYL